MKLSEKAKQRVDKWISETGRNQFGDPQSTIYAGGNPLFDERRAGLRDKYEYILSRHPELKDLLKRELDEDI